jgi:hypothetical protein
MYDSKHGEFRIIFFSNNGPYTEAGNRYAGRVEGGTLTMVGTRPGGVDRRGHPPQLAPPG